MVVSDGHELELRLLHILRRGLGLSWMRVGNSFIPSPL